MAPIPNETGPEPPSGGFLRRMLDPRATYNETEAKASRGWWALFIAGIILFGLLSLIAIIIVWYDKKFLKQMGLAVFYLNVPFLVGALTVGTTIIDGIQDLAGIGFILLFFGGVGAPVGFGIAAYAQRKIDRMPPADDE